MELSGRCARSLALAGGLLPVGVAKGAIAGESAMAGADAGLVPVAVALAALLAGACLGLVALLGRQHRRLRHLERERQSVASLGAFHASLLAQVNTAVVATDLEHVITYWNPCAEALYQWRADEVVGRKSPDLGFLQIDDGLAGTIWQSLQDAGSWAGEMLTRRRDGSAFTVLCTIASLRDAGGRVIGHVAVLNDVSQRRAAEESLRRSERRYRELVETSHDLIWSIDADGRLSFVNRDAAQRMFGFAPEQIEGRHFTELIPLDHVQGDVEAFRRARAGEPRFQFEIAYRRADGRRVHLDVTGVTVCDEQGRLVRSTGTAADVTERKLQEGERVRYTKQLQELARTAVLVTSELSSDALLRIVAERARIIIGARRAFAGAQVGRSDTALFAAAPASEAETRAGMREFVIRGAPSAQQSFAPTGCLVSALTRRDGSAMGSIVVEDKLEGEFSASDQSILAQLASLASVAIVNAELFDEIQRASARLEERVAERTAELREVNAGLEAFAYTVSHDLRAPLNAMRGFADVLVDEFAQQLDPAGRRHLEMIVKAADRMEKLIADLLEFCRIGGNDLPREPLDLNAAVRAAVLQVEPVLRRQRARITVTGPSLIVSAHRGSLVQSVANLLLNAVKFVAAETIPRVRVELAPGDGVARLWVRDNGIGIPEEDRERIFDPFERLHGRDAYPGTGLGLAIVRRAVARMAGRVGVESRPGEGSSFWIDVPLAPEGALPAGGGRARRRRRSAEPVAAPAGPAPAAAAPATPAYAGR
ncbi:MAG: PAS domain S-box protein [Thermodesulfobacteriota bacterium]